MAVSFDMAGRVVIITGGTRGIGRVIASRFLDAGATVVVCGRTTPQDVPTGTDAAAHAHFIATDVRQPEQAADLVRKTAERFGRLDVLINNAGGTPIAAAATMSPRFASSIVSLNLLAPFYTAQPANAVMQQQPDGGLIINIGSVSGRVPAPGSAPYSAAKAGLSMLTRALALEWAPKVRVNQVTAGLVRTERAHLHYGNEEGLAAVAATIPIGRMAEPADVAGACLLLCSPLAHYMNGADLLLDGGGERPARFLAAAAHPHDGKPGDQAAR